MASPTPASAAHMAPAALSTPAKAAASPAPVVSGAGGNPTTTTAPSTAGGNSRSKRPGGQKHSFGVLHTGYLEKMNPSQSSGGLAHHHVPAYKRPSCALGVLMTGVGPAQPDWSGLNGCGLGWDGHAFDRPCVETHIHTRPHTSTHILKKKTHSTWTSGTPTSTSRRSSGASWS